MDKAAGPQAAQKSELDFLRGELKELASFVTRQAFNQIPSLSAVSGIIAGAWVMSTFTASPIKGALAEWGLIDGATHVVSSGTYKFLAVVLPILATSVTAYAVHKALHSLRETQIELYQYRAARLDEETLCLLRSKLTALENAKTAGILSWGEYRAKMAGIYHPFVGRPRSKAEKAFMNKVGAKIQ